jgi:hypothetical protein
VAEQVAQQHVADLLLVEDRLVLRVEVGDVEDEVLERVEGEGARRDKLDEAVGRAGGEGEGRLFAVGDVLR